VFNLRVESSHTAYTLSGPLASDTSLLRSVAIRDGRMVRMLPTSSILPRAREGAVLAAVGTADQEEVTSRPHVREVREIKEGLRQRMHRPIPETGKMARAIVAGYFAYHAVPTNSPALSAFRYHVLVLWHRQLCRRSQRARVLWTRMTKLADEFLPRRESCILDRVCASPSDTRGRSRVPELAILPRQREARARGANPNNLRSRSLYPLQPVWSSIVPW
jgi:hypothetical protein